MVKKDISHKIKETAVGLFLLGTFMCPLLNPIMTGFKERPKEWTYKVQLGGWALGTICGVYLDKKNYKDKPEDYNFQE